MGELEQIVLLAILRVGDAAYGVTIADEIQRQASRDLALATIYKTLSRLEAKGMVESRVGEPTAERGGRRKRYYALTQQGRVALKQSLSILRRMTRGLQVAQDLTP